MRRLKTSGNTSWKLRNCEHALIWSLVRRATVHLQTLNSCKTKRETSYERPATANSVGDCCGRLLGRRNELGSLGMSSYVSPSGNLARLVPELYPIWSESLRNGYSEDRDDLLRPRSAISRFSYKAFVHNIILVTR